MMLCSGLAALGATLTPSMEAIVTCRASQNSSHLVPTVVKHRNGSTHYVMAAFSKHQDVVSRFIANTGVWEDIYGVDDVVGWPAVGGTFLDIGANLGYLSFKFASARFNVFAVEPIPTNRRAIQTTLCAHPEMATSGFHLIPTAVGTFNGSCKMTMNGNNRGNAHLKCSPNDRHPTCANGKRSSAGCEVVPVVPLDEALAIVPTDASRPVVTKIDLEGHECQALETGAQTLFGRLGVDYLFIETQHSWVSKCVNETADKYGYVVGEAQGDNKNRLLKRRHMHEGHMRRNAEPQRAKSDRSHGLMATHGG